MNQRDDTDPHGHGDATAPGPEEASANRPADRTGERRYRLGNFWESSFVEVAKLDFPDLLRRAGLPEDLYERRTARVTAEEYGRLWRVLSAQSDATDSALYLGRTMLAPVPLKPFVIAALCCDDLNQAFHRLTEYRAGVRPVNLRVEEAPTHTHITVTYPDGARVPALLALATLVFLTELARTATGHHVAPLAATCVAATPDDADYEAFFGCDLQVADTWSITFGIRDLRRAMVASPLPWVLDLPESLLPTRVPLDAAETTVDAVRHALSRRLPTGESSIQRIASDLDVSARTLQRRLSAEHTTFQAVLHDTRDGLARWLLSHSNLGNEAITFALGYDSTISFFRSFKEWTGTTPDRYRQQVQS